MRSTTAIKSKNFNSNKNKTIKTIKITKTIHLKKRKMMPLTKNQMTVNLLTIASQTTIKKTLIIKILTVKSQIKPHQTITKKSLRKPPNNKNHQKTKITKTTHKTLFKTTNCPKNSNKQMNSGCDAYLTTQVIYLGENSNINLNNDRIQIQAINNGKENLILHFLSNAQLIHQ